jgi:hypothetical protein
MRRRVTTLVLAAMAVLMMVMAPVGAAQADAQPRYDSVHLYTEHHLRWLPKDSWADARQERPGGIYLARGTYEWQVNVYSDWFYEEPLYIAEAGWYSWRAQLDPKDYYYNVSSVLEGPQYKRIVNDDIYLPHDGDYVWGSALVPINLE